MTKNEMTFIKEVGLLTETNDVENRQLVYNYVNGDKNSMTRLMSGMIKLICKLAKQQINSYEGDLYTIHDLISAGCIGLEKACWKFDPNANTKFSSYSYWWIIKYMYEEKKHWGIMDLSLDDPLPPNLCMDAEYHTLKDILNEDEVNERINMLRMKAKKNINKEQIDE